MKGKPERRPHFKSRLLSTRGTGVALVNRGDSTRANCCNVRPLIANVRKDSYFYLSLEVMVSCLLLPAVFVITFLRKKRRLLRLHCRQSLSMLSSEAEMAPCCCCRHPHSEQSPGAVGTAQLPAALCVPQR